MKYSSSLAILLGVSLAGPPMLTGSASAESATFRTTPTADVTVGETYTIQTRYSVSGSGTLSVQLFDDGWSTVAQKSANTTSGTRNKNFSVAVPASTQSGSGGHWMVQARNSNGSTVAQSFRNNVTLSAASTATAASATFASTPPSSVTRGVTTSIPVNYSYPTTGILKVQLFNSGWTPVATSNVVTVAAGSGSRTLNLTVPSSVPTGGGHIWMVQVTNNSGGNKAENFSYNVTLSGSGSSNPTSSGNQFLPGNDSDWTLDWNDEFTGNGINGTGEPANWFAHLGTGWYNYETEDEAGLRYSGFKPGQSGTENSNSSWMFSTKFANTLSDGKGTYWLDGNGHLILRAVVDKRDTLNNSKFKNDGVAGSEKVECAYLETGHPVKATASNSYPRPSGFDPWEGKFVEPGANGIYLACRAKLGQLNGWSTWFAFWAHTHTQAYDNKTGSAFSSDDGTEIDIVEIWGSKAAYTFNAFTHNNHWRDDPADVSPTNPTGDPGSVGIRYDFGPPNDPDPPFGLKVQDGNWHEYGVDWTKEELIYYVDGHETFRTSSHVPSDPNDMMILLTMEFTVDKWDGAGQQGDSRTSTDPNSYVSDNATLREMSRAQVDWVRVFKKN